MSDSQWVRRGAWALALGYVWWLLRWSVRPEHYFFADDWDWLYRAALFPWKGQFSLLPQYVPNDRPMGALVFRVLYRAFGLNPVPFHWFCVLLHLTNVMLVAALGQRLMRSWWAAAAAALAYGTWSAAIEPATWMAGIFDLLGCTLILVTALAFSSPRWAVRAASVIFFYFALRTKETAIVLPVLLAVIVMVCYPRREWIAVGKRTLLPHVVLALVFVAVYVPLIARGHSAWEASNPYRMEPTPRVAAQGLYFYASAMFYGRPWPLGRLIRWGAALALLGAGVVWGSRATSVGLAGFVLFLAPVLFLSHHRQALYLYIPAAFFALALGGAAEAVADRLAARPAWREPAAVAILLVCIVALPHWAHMRHRADWIVTHTLRAKQDLDAFRAKVAVLRPEARVALVGFPEDYHVFQTYGCPALRLLYHVDGVSCAASEDGAGADVVVRYRREGIEVR